MLPWRGDIRAHGEWCWGCSALVNCDVADQAETLFWDPQERTLK